MMTPGIVLSPDNIPALVPDPLIFYHQNTKDLEIVPVAATPLEYDKNSVDYSRLVTAFLYGL